MLRNRPRWLDTLVYFLGFATAVTFYGGPPWMYLAGAGCAVIFTVIFFILERLGP